jgi:hypothetical protein
MAQTTPKGSIRLTQSLKEFRVRLEKEMGEPLADSDDPAVLLVLDELCGFLKVDRKEVLGIQGVETVSRIVG